MDASSSPYTPDSSRPPVGLIGRSENPELFSSLITQGVRSLGPSQPILLLGLHSVGKTVLLNHMLQEAGDANWVTMKLEVNPGAVGVTTAYQVLIRGSNAIFFTRSAQAPTLRARQVFTTITSLSISFGLTDVSFSVARDLGRVSTSDCELDLLDAVIDATEVLRNENEGTAFSVDKLQDLDPGLLAALLSYQHECSRRVLPFYIAGAGLPNLPKILAEAESYAEKMFNVRIINSLSTEGTHTAFLGPAHTIDAKLDGITLRILTRTSQGYPYLIQGLGSTTWRIAEDSPSTVYSVRNALFLGFAQLDSGFFPTRWDRATPAERNYLSAVVFGGPQPPTTSSIAKRLGKRVQSFGPVRISLIPKGLTCSPKLDRVAFTVPGFYDFTQRRATLAEWSSSRFPSTSALL